MWSYLGSILFGIAAFGMALFHLPVAPAPHPITVRPLESSLRDSWTQKSGQWDFDQNISLTGSGESTIEFDQAFKPPFRLTCDIEVLKGMRPRIYFGSIYHFGNEGYTTTYGLFPGGDVADRYPYELNKKYKAQIDITTRSVRVRVDGHLVDVRDVGMSLIPKISFRGGDGWSPGTTRFSNIVISAVPVKPDGN